MGSEKHRGSANSTTISSDLETGADSHPKSRGLPTSPAAETNNILCQSIEPPSSTSRLISGWWYLELACMVLSLAVFGFYCWVLKRWDQHLWQEWFDNRPSFIFKYFVKNLGSAASSIMSTLKILMFIPITASMGQLKWHYLFQRRFPRPVAELQTFDAASRGVSGSIKLIVSDKRFHSIHITLGCVLFLATLYLGSATQNTISYVVQDYWAVDHGLNNTGTATLPVTELFNATPRYDILGVDNQNLNEDPSMQAALFTAWSYVENNRYDYLTYDPIPSTCTTDYCRWFNTTSLAVKHECQSVSANHTTGVGRSDQANITLSVNPATNGSSNTMPAILHLKASSTMPDDSVFMTPHNRNRALIVHLAAIADHNEQRIDATECILYWVAEHSLETFYNNATGLKINQTIHSTYDLPENRTSTEDDKDIVLKAPCNTNNGTDLCQFNVTQAAHLGLRKLLKETLTGYVYRNPSQDGTIFKASSPLINLFAWSWKENLSDWEDPCPLNSTLHDYMKYTAIGLSGYIRSIKYTELNGQNGSDEGVYTIAWVYVIFPGVMLILSLYLFAFTVWLTRGMPAWKTSLLPFLYHGFDRPVSYEGYDLSSLPWMGEISKEKKVVLRDDDDGLGLRLREAKVNSTN